MKYLGLVLLFSLIAVCLCDSRSDYGGFENLLPSYLRETSRNLERARKISRYLNTVKFSSSEEVEIPEFNTERDVTNFRARRSVIGPETGNVIVLGTTTALTGAELPYSTESFSYITFTVNYINDVLGGIEINDTMYKVKLVWYDDASNCELISILSQRLIVVDQVDVIIAGTTLNCTGTTTMAEQYGVPCINGGNYNFFFQFPDGLNWTVVPILNPIYTSAPCIQQFCKDGATSAVVASTDIIYPSLNYSLLYDVPLYCKNFSLLYFDQLDYDSVTGADYMDYLEPFIQKWKNSGADLLFGGVGPDQAAFNFFNAMRYHKYNPGGYFGWDDLGDVQTRQMLGWLGYGATAASSFDTSFNFTDPIFTNTQVFDAAYLAAFNETATTYVADNALLVILAVIAIKNAGSFDPLAIRHALFNFNQSTIQGQTYFNNVTGYTTQQTECFQFKGANEYVVVGDPVFNSETLTYPWNFEYIPGYKFAPKPRTWWQKNKNILLPCVTVIPFAIIIITGVAIYFFKKWHVIFIPDTKLDKTEW